MCEHPEELFDPNKTSSRKAFLDEIKKNLKNTKFFDSREQMEEMTIRDFTRNIVYNPKSNLYVNQAPLYPSLDKTIKIIHKAGGITFLAHLYEYSPTIADSLEDITDNYKLDGIECYYATFTREQSNFLKKYCETHNLYKSCGSDFHGYEVKPNNHMGFATEGEKMEKSIISEWLDKVNHILKPVSTRQKFIESIKNKGISSETKTNGKIERSVEKDKSIEL